MNRFRINTQLLQRLENKTSNNAALNLIQNRVCTSMHVKLLPNLPFKSHVKLRWSFDMFSAADDDDVHM